MSPLCPPPDLPDYEIMGRIGGGSYGEVWLARSVTGAKRAVKVIRRCAFSNDRPYDREFRGIVQCEPVSRLHPDLISILHVGRDDAAGFFFYVMELADNAESPPADPALAEAEGASAIPAVPTSGYKPRTLALDLKTKGRLPVAEVLRLGVQVAGALGHLHRHGLVHRDVKPSNVIFIRGQPKLADIGLVAGKDETRSFVGTEGFVPPEGHGTERADLFSLGRLLYEAATGKDRCEFPELPDDLDRWPAEEREALLELNEVLVRACAADPSKRHANAADFAADLNTVLGGRSIRRMYGVERRLLRARQASAAALGVLVVTGGVMLLQDQARRSAEIRASEEAVLRRRAEAAERAAQRQLYTALLEQARAKRLSRELGQRVQTLSAVRRAAVITNSAELRREAFAALALPDLRLEREVVFPPGQVASILDPAFTRYAVGNARGPVEVRALSDRRLLASLSPSTNLEAHLLTWSPDGRFLGFKRDHDPGGHHADLEVWDVAATNRVVRALDSVTANSLDFHPREPRVMAGSAAGEVRIWDLNSGEEIRCFALTWPAVHVQFSPDGERFTATAFAPGGSAISVHDASTGELRSRHYFTNWMMRADWHPDGRRFAALDYAGNVRMVDPETDERQMLGQHKAAAVSAAFSPGGDFMITGGWERELICWDLRTMKRAFTIGINGSHVRFRNDGRQCVIYGPERAILFEFKRPDSHRQFHEHLGPWLAYGAFSPDGDRLAASGDDWMAIWDLRKDGPAAMVPNRRDRVPRFSSDGSELYAYWHNRLYRWGIEDAVEGVPRLEQRPIFVPPEVQSICVVSNELILTGMKGIYFMPSGNTDAGKVRFLPKAGGLGIVSPDGRWICLRYWKQPLTRIYTLPEVERAAFLTNRAEVWTTAFSPKGDELAVVTSRGLEFYEVGTWRLTRELSIPCERQSTVLFSPDGESFWFTSDARTSGLRDTRTLEVLLPLPAGILPLALSADGRKLAVSADMQGVQVWDLERVRHHFQELGLRWW